MSTETECDFVYSEWISLYPEFKQTVTPEQANNYATLAASFFNPTRSSVVCCPKERKTLFYLLVAHYAALSLKRREGTQLSGMINNVSEGSISISSDTSGLSKVDPWLAQTGYGVDFWALTKKYRSAFYIRPIPDPRLRISP